MSTNCQWKKEDYFIYDKLPSQRKGDLEKICCRPFCGSLATHFEFLDRVRITVGPYIFDNISFFGNRHDVFIQLDQESSPNTFLISEDIMDVSELPSLNNKYQILVKFYLGDYKQALMIINDANTKLYHCLKSSSNILNFLNF